MFNVPLRSTHAHALEKLLEK